MTISDLVRVKQKKSIADSTCSRSLFVRLCLLNAVAGFLPPIFFNPSLSTHILLQPIFWMYLTQTIFCNIISSLYILQFDTLPISFIGSFIQGLWFRAFELRFLYLPERLSPSILSFYWCGVIPTFPGKTGRGIMTVLRSTSPVRPARHDRGSICSSEPGLCWCVLLVCLWHYLGRRTRDR